jgi:hypothetical protein
VWTGGRVLRDVERNKNQWSSDHRKGLLATIEAHDLKRDMGLPLDGVGKK